MTRIAEVIAMRRVRGPICILSMRHRAFPVAARSQAGRSRMTSAAAAPGPSVHLVGDEVVASAVGRALPIGEDDVVEVGRTFAITLLFCFSMIGAEAFTMTTRS